MIDVYVLDGNLNAVGMVDAYKSLIWANRYNDLGDCELCVDANAANIDLLQEGRYLMRLDDEMVCRIKKIEIDTSAEDGNYLIVTGYDTKDFLDQRITWGTITCNGNLEDFIRQLATLTLISPFDDDRRLAKPNGETLLQLGPKAGFTKTLSEQISFKNIGEKIREFCKNNHWGYKFSLAGAKLSFSLYAGADRSSEVIFSEEYENLSTTKYTHEITAMGNIALIGGAGEGADRATSSYGWGYGAGRYEVFVDARDIARSITWKELTEAYPPTGQGGQGYITTEGEQIVYKMSSIDIPIMDAAHLAWLESHVPGGTIVTVAGEQYYRVANATIASLQTDAPEDNSPVILLDVVYLTYLINRGIEKLAEYGETTTFEGVVIPDVTFVYKRDYFLGDIVLIESEYGISARCRIVEVIEVVDENGYKVEPKFEYLEG